MIGHHWQPVAPLARIEVDIEGSDGWQGEGYFDANWGSEPLEAGFRRWDWSRGSTGDSATILYDATRSGWQRTAARPALFGRRLRGIRSTATPAHRSRVLGR